MRWPEERKALKAQVNILMAEKNLSGQVVPQLASGRSEATFKDAPVASCELTVLSWTDVTLWRNDRC